MPCTLTKDAIKIYFGTSLYMVTILFRRFVTWMRILQAFAKHFSIEYKETFGDDRIKPGPGKTKDGIDLTPARQSQYK